MKKCLVEIIFSLRRNNAMIGLILILCALCFGGGKILYSYIKTMELIEDKYEKTYTEQYIYQVVEHEDAPLRSPFTRVHGSLTAAPL